MFVNTIGGQSVGLPCLGVSGIYGGLLHAAELRLAGIRRHWRGCRRGKDVRIRPEEKSSPGEVSMMKAYTPFCVCECVCV